MWGGRLAAGFAALRSYAGQLATSEKEESLAEATGQTVTRADGSCERRETGDSTSTQHTSTGTLSGVSGLTM